MSNLIYKFMVNTIHTWPPPLLPKTIRKEKEDGENDYYQTEIDATINTEQL